MGIFLYQISLLSSAVCADSEDWQPQRKNQIVNNKTSICKAITNVTCLLTDSVVLEFDGFE